MSLTAGAIRNIFNNKVDGNPLVQIIDVKKISNPKNNSERYRLVISDGQHYQQSMLATQLNHMVTDGPIKEYCVIQLTEFICSEVANRKIAFILALKFVDNGPGHRIGNPSNVEQDQNAQARQQQQQNQGVKEEKQHNNNSNPYLNRGNNNHMQQPQRNNQAKREFHPIASLTPYHSRWTIKARVTKKGDMRTWSNQRGEGKLFSVDLLDKQGMCTHDFLWAR